MTPAPTTLQVDQVEPGIWRITLDRPAKRNPLTRRCVRELAETVEQLAQLPTCRVIVLRGAGPSFSGGYGSLPEDREDGEVPVAELSLRSDIESMRRYGRAWARILDAPVPVLAQVHGACLNGATDLVLHCDLVVVADDAVLGFPAVRSMGAPPTHMWLYHLGPQWTKRLLLTGDRITGATAERLGLAVASFPADQLEEGVLALARRMACIDRDLLAANKAIVNHGMELMGRRLLQEVAATADAVGHRAEAAERTRHLTATEGVRAAADARDAPFRALGDDPI